MNWRTQKTDQSAKSKDQKQPQPFRKVIDTKYESKTNEKKIESQYNTEPSSSEQPKYLKDEEVLIASTNKNTNQLPEQKVLPNNIIPTNMGFNQNPLFNFMQQQNAMFQQFMPTIVMQGDSNFDIKVLQKYNKKLQYPENLPLWYLFHPMIKSSFGPMTTSQIESMYNSKQIFSNSLIRFIDIYERKDTDQFNFFPIKELENENLLNEIIPSKILKYLYVDNLNLIDTKELEVKNNNSINVEEIIIKKEEELDEVVEQDQYNDQKNKKPKKKKYRPTEEAIKPEKTYTPSINTYNTNPTPTSFVNSNTDEINDWEQIGKVKKVEKSSNKIVGTNPIKTSNITTPQTKKVLEKPQNFEPTKLMEMLNPKKKIEQNSEIIETENVSQQNKINSGGNKKGKKGAKAKFTDFNVEIGILI